MKFILISTFARFPSVISSTLVGANIVGGNWKIGVILYVAIVLAVGAIVLIINKFDKDEITKQAIKTIK